MTQEMLSIPDGSPISAKPLRRPCFGAYSEATDAAETSGRGMRVIRKQIQRIGAKQHGGKLGKRA